MEVPKIASLELREATFSARYGRQLRKRLFRDPVEYLVFSLVVTIGEREIVFNPGDVASDRLERLFEYPQRLIIGDGPFFTGLDFPDSYISELAERNNVAEGSLIIIDDDSVLATVWNDEISALQSWMRKVVDALSTSQN